MFFYVYDTLVLSDKYAKTLALIEGRIIELGINGRVEKLTALRNLKELLEDGVKRSAHTIVVVGNDTAFVRAVNILAVHPVVLGYIPFDPESRLAKIFGIPSTMEACNILSRRIIKTFGIAKANQNYFLTALTTEPHSGYKLLCDDRYTITSRQRELLRISVLNLGLIFTPQSENMRLGTATSNTCSLHIEACKAHRLWSKTIPYDTSQFTIKKLNLQSLTDEPLAVSLDGATILKTPITVTVKPKALRLIVGKTRLV